MVRVVLAASLEVFQVHGKLTPRYSFLSHLPRARFSGSPGMRRAFMGFGAGCGVGSSWVVCSQDFAKK